MNLSIPEKWTGQRADKVLAQLAQVSRTVAREALETGAVLLDETPVAPADRVQTGQRFTGTFPESPPSLEPERVDFEVRYEDGHVAVVDKPAGVVTHPGAGNRRGTLAAGLLARWPTIEGVGATDRWGIVHRLDRDTSGLLAVALSAEAFGGLVASMRRREIVREYLSLVAGAPETESGTIDAAIGRDPRRPTRMRIDPSGRRAITHYRVEWTTGDRSLLRLTLETGRTHQIRVHLASIGLPVAGDRQYGRAALSPRLFLHATRLSFRHPVTGGDVDVRSPLPQDLADVLVDVGAPEGA